MHYWQVTYRTYHKKEVVIKHFYCIDQTAALARQRLFQVNDRAVVLSIECWCRRSAARRRRHLNKINNYRRLQSNEY